MGYTHYIDRAPELDLPTWRRWVGDVRRIIDNLPERTPTTFWPLDGPPITVDASLIVAGPLGVGLPVHDDDLVSFNGGGLMYVNGHLVDLGCETFHVERVLEPREWDQPDEKGWYTHYCKTAQQPYYLAVTASLVRLAHHFPEGVEIGSDGEPEEWRATVDLCRQVFGQAELTFAVHPADPKRAADEPEVDRLDDLVARRRAGLLAPDELGELQDLLRRDLEPDAEPDPAGATLRLKAPECSP